MTLLFLGTAGKYQLNAEIMDLMETNRQAKLSNWISHQHRGQLIKCTKEPYYEHLKTVAEMAAEYASFGYEVGLGHDLLEKTPVISVDFYQALMGFGYKPVEADEIISQVIELTDVFTKVAYPDLKKHERKEREEHRLATISPDAQTVKYADLIYNMNWMINYDRENALDYLARKRKLLLSMTSGNAILRKRALDMIKSYFLT